MEVAPREFVFTLQNYQKAYASEYTYSTFSNSLIFASGSAALSFLLGTILAWLTERTNTPLRGIFCPHRGGALDSTRCVGVHRVDFSLEPEVCHFNVWLKSLSVWSRRRSMSFHCRE